jgi:hypothetical protein
MLDPLLLPRVFDENAPHGLCGGAEEVYATFPPHRFIPDQSKVCLMDQGGRLERVPRTLVRHVRACQSPQLVINQWQQLCGRLPVALSDGIEQPGGIIHVAQ